VRRVLAGAVGITLLAGCGASTGSAGGPPPSATLPPPVTTTSTTEPPTLPPTVYEPPTEPLPLPEALRLGEGGIGRFRFGDDADTVIAGLSGLLGQDDEDSDWGPPATRFGACPANEARALRWGWLVAFFVDSSPFGDGRRHFAGWRYGYGVDDLSLYPEGLQLGVGIAPGDRLAVVKAAHPGAVETEPPTETGPARFQVGTSYGGTLDGAGDDAVITTLEAGIRCR
jgi:hypothetical protein